MNETPNPLSGNQEPTGLTSERFIPKFLKSKLCKAALIGAVSAGLIFGGAKAAKNAENRQPLPNAPTDIEEEQNERVFGENEGELANGVYYNYQHYADADNKETKWAYDYDYSDRFSDKEATIDGILEVASRTPEALSSYAYNIFTDEEKEELGIKGMSMTELDNYLSNADNIDGGTKQKAIQAKFEEVLRDGKTTYNFYYENSIENTNYILFVDANQDGKMTPDEMTLRFSTKKRNNSEQVDVYRLLEMKDGSLKKVKMMDLNMKCGFQPNYEASGTPDDLVELPPEQEQKQDQNQDTEKPKPKPEPNTTGGGGDPIPTPIIIGGGGDPDPDPVPYIPPVQNWSKTSNAHAGGTAEQVLSEAPAAESEVSAEQNSQANANGQGHVIDLGAKPGDSSDSYGAGIANSDNGFAASGIITEGATTEEGHLEGGEDQSVDASGKAEMAGENAHQDQSEVEAGEAFDAQGNNAQAEAWSDISSAPSGAPEAPAPEAPPEEPAPASQASVDAVDRGDF